MDDNKCAIFSGGNAKLSQSDFVTNPLLLSLGHYPLVISEDATRFGKIFREVLGKARFAFSLEQTHVFSSKVVMDDLQLSADTNFWTKTLPQNTASRLPREYWWHVVPETETGVGTRHTPEWRALLNGLPPKCEFWHSDMEMQLNKKGTDNRRLMGEVADHQESVIIWMNSVNRLYCLAMMFPPFLPAETFATEPMPNLVHQMLWRMDSVRAGQLCTVYIPEQLERVANRRRAFVLAHSGVLTGLPGRLTEPEEYTKSARDPKPPQRIADSLAFITLLHTFLSAELVPKLRSSPAAYLSIADGLIYTVIQRYLFGHTNGPSEKQLRSSRSGTVFPSILPSKLANTRYQPLFVSLQARYDYILSHVAASLKQLQKLLTLEDNVVEAVPTLVAALSHAALTASYVGHRSFHGTGAAWQLPSIEVVTADEAYDMLLRKMYICQAEALFALVSAREGKDMDISSNSNSNSNGSSNDSKSTATQANDIVCLKINDIHAESLQESFTMLCGEKALLLAASWFDPLCPQSATKSLIVVHAATLWQCQRLGIVGLFLPALFTPNGSAAFKSARGNADGKEWNRLSHAPIVEQLCMSKFASDGIAILRSWFGLGQLMPDERMDEDLKAITVLASQMLQFLVVWLHSDEHVVEVKQGINMAPADRVALVAKRIRVVLAYSPLDLIEVPTAAFVLLQNNLIKLGDGSEHDEAAIEFFKPLGASQQGAIFIAVHIADLLSLLRFLIEKNRTEANQVIFALLDSCQVTTNATNASLVFGVDNDEAYALDNLKLQLNRRRPLDKYEFAAADCVCSDEKQQFSVQLAQVVGHIERLFYRPTPAIAAVLQENIAQSFAMRVHLHYCPATFDLPVAWYRTTTATGELHLNSKLPVLQNVIEDDLDVPSSLRFILTSTADAPPHEHLFALFNKANHEAKTGESKAGPFVRSKAVAVRRIGAAATAPAAPAAMHTQQVQPLPPPPPPTETKSSPARDPRLRQPQQTEIKMMQDDFGESDTEEPAAVSTSAVPMETSSAAAAAAAESVPMETATNIEEVDNEAQPTIALADDDDELPTLSPKATQTTAGADSADDSDEDQDTSFKRRRQDSPPPSAAPVEVAATSNGKDEKVSTAPASSSSNAPPRERSRSRSKSHSPRPRSRPPRRRSRSRSPVRRRDSPRRSHRKPKVVK